MSLKQLITEAVVVDTMFDVEDELLNLKETILEQMIIEGVDDPGILKCVFMAGGPGSGKSFTAMEIFGIDKKLKSSFSATGLKSVNSDSAFEAGLKKNGIDPKDLARIEKEDAELWDLITKTPGGIRDKAKQLTQKQKKFYEGIEQLKLLSDKNEIEAQLLYSKILFSGDLTPQDFEKSYFWASSAFLGGEKKSKKIIDRLNDYLTEKQKDNIKDKLKVFLEKRVFNKVKRAIIQVAKFYEGFLNPPDIVNAYTWYNIAVAVGIKTAKIKRNEFLNKLNEEDLLKAQTLSIKLFKQINS